MSKPVLQNYLITDFQSIFPTLKGKILASSFGVPEIFRAPQNTTCYVRLNIKLSIEITAQNRRIFRWQDACLRWSYYLLLPTNNGRLVGLPNCWLV